MSEYKDMPASFILCAAGEGQCPKREDCLRSLCYRDDESPVLTHRFLQTVNLRCPGLGACTDECEAFCSNQKLRMAYGMTHIYDDVPQRIYKTVKEGVQQCFSCERVYFYSKSGQRPITPAVQEAIAAVFSRHGIASAPRFDRFEDAYDWKQPCCKARAALLQKPCSITAKSMQRHCTRHAARMFQKLADKEKFVQFGLDGTLFWSNGAEHRMLLLQHDYVTPSCCGIFAFKVVFGD